MESFHTDVRQRAKCNKLFPWFYFMFLMIFTQIPCLSLLKDTKKTGLLSAVTIAAQKTTFQYLTLSLPDKICNSPYHQSYNSYNFSSENLILDQLIIPKLIFFFFHNTYLVDTVLILSGETLSWSLMGVKSSANFCIKNACSPTKRPFPPPPPHLIQC